MGRYRTPKFLFSKGGFLPLLKDFRFGACLVCFSDSAEEETLTDGLLLSGASHPELFDIGDLWDWLTGSALVLRVDLLVGVVAAGFRLDPLVFEVPEVCFFSSPSWVCANAYPLQEVPKFSKDMVLDGKIVLGNTEEMRGRTSVSIFQGINQFFQLQVMYQETTTIPVPVSSA